MDQTTWIMIVLILILLGVLFYLKTKRQGEESKTDVIEEEPMTMKEESDVPEKEEPGKDKRM